MDFLTLQNNVFRLMRDAAHTKYSDIYIKEWLNNAEQKYCTLTEYSVKKDTTLISIIGTQEYSLPSDYKNEIAVFYNGDPLSFIRIQDTIDSVPESGTPSRYYIRNNKIGLEATPATAGDTITIIYYSVGGDMSADGDDPIIPKEHHMLLVFWACYLCSLEGDDTRVNMFHANFFNGIKDAQDDNMKRSFGEWPVVGEVRHMPDPVDHDVLGII